MQDLRRHLGPRHSYPGEDSIALLLRTPLTTALLTVTCLVASGAAPTATAVEPDAATVTVTAPSDPQVVLGTPVPLGGVVADGAGRTVRLELRTGTGWLPLATTLADDAGAFALPVPTDWYLRGPLRVSVPATTDLPAGVSDEVALAVVPTYSPRGSATDWKRLVAGVRWDPCGDAIRWKVNQAGVADRRITELKAAFGRLRAATGLRFSYAGRTDAVPYRTDGGKPSRSDADFTVAFSTSRVVGGLAGTVVGKGGMAYRSTGEATHGFAVLDKSARLEAGFGVGHTWGTLMLHELAHGVGLSHASGAEQVMHSGITDRSRGDFQAGDLTGLALQGAGTGCLAPTLARTTGGTRTISAY